MRRMSWRVSCFLLCFLAGSVLTGCGKHPGLVTDEAQQAGRTAASFPQATENYFRGMDREQELTKPLTTQEIQGRNMWVVWSGGNDRFWDSMTKYTYGALDLLKIVTSDPCLRPPPDGGSGTPDLCENRPAPPAGEYPRKQWKFWYERKTRWQDIGLVNEPCFEEAQGPDKARFDLWLDVRGKGCAADPFADETKYPGVKIGARGKVIGKDASGKDVTLPVGSYYGYPTGIVGLRLFPNPDFDAQAYKHWDAKKYYSDPLYYSDPKLVRPYRVGMSCGFCHVGPSPVKPPADPENPQFENLSSSVGAQYMWVDRLFVFNANNAAGQQNFTYQMLHTWRPGTMDTSLVSTDNINNPRTMNAVYSFVARMGLAKQLWHEKLANGELHNKQFNDFVPPDSPLADYWDASSATTKTPHVLKDGSDSVGLLGALNRVYLNIGLFSEEWVLHFNPVVGGKPISPIEIAVADKNSAYWQATTQGTPNTALFFLKAALPDRLTDFSEGSKERGYLSTDAKRLEHGKEVFANTCARCHSSKAPEPPSSIGSPESCAGPSYLECFKRYWAWTQTDEFKQKMRAKVLEPDFLVGNYLSTEARIPVTLLRTNICSPLATNALAGNIWDNFSSHTYKSLPSVGKVSLRSPFNGAPFVYEMPAGGRGYTRVPSLIGLWSTSPYLLNNTVGSFDPDPSVEHRVKSFQEAIEQMLWPEKRELDTKLGDSKVGKIDRTDERSALRVPIAYIPAAVQPLGAALQKVIPSLTADKEGISLGPIPKGMPVGLLASLDLLPPEPVALRHGEVLFQFVRDLNADLKKAPPNATDDQLLASFANLGEPLLYLSKCPDYVVNRGHYFGTAQFNDQANLTADERAFGPEPVLSDDDKRALIEFLKTF